MTMVLISADQLSNSSWGNTSPVAQFVCLGERISGNTMSDADVVQFPTHGVKACFDIAKAFPVCQLRERQHEEMVVAREFSDACIASVPCDTSSEALRWEMIHDLREYRSSRIHGGLLLLGGGCPVHC
jgi:hypothetical protein